MRVVAGSVGGRRLAGPRSTATRPTSDRVREAMFNSLESNGRIDGALVVDLFAGTGACGIEALSRGAAHVTFVDSDRRAVEVIRHNLADLEMTGDADVVTADAMAFLSAPHSFDLAIVDPPYRFSAWPEVLGALDARLVVCEASRDVEPVDGYRLARRRKHGETRTTIFEKAGT